MAAKGDLDVLITHLDQSISVLPERSHSLLQKMIFSSILDKGDAELLDTTKHALSNEPIRTFDGAALIQLYGFFESGDVVWPGLEGIIEVFQSAIDNERKQLKAEAESVLFGHYASLLAASDRIDEAIAAMNTSVSLDTTSVEARIRLASLYIDTDQIDNAIDTLNGLSEEEKAKNADRIKEIGIELKTIKTAIREN